MKNKIQINLGADHALESTEKVIGRAGEGLVSRLEIAVPEALSNYDAYIDFEKPNGETLRTPRLEVEYGVAYYDVPQYLLAENGEIKVQLVFEKANGSVWKSSKKRYTILKSINAVEDIPDKEDFITQAQKLIDELNQEVEEIADVLANDYKFAQAVIDACGGQRKITTINGIALRFFLGKKEDFDAYSDAEKQNVFAIFTDDTAREALLNEIEDTKQALEEHKQLCEDELRNVAKVYSFEISGDRDDIDGDFYHYCYEFPVGTLLTFKNHSEYEELSFGTLWAPLYYYVLDGECETMHFYGDEVYGDEELREFHIKILGVWTCLGKCSEGIYLAQRIN